VNGLLDDVALFLQEVDERFEELTLMSVFVEISGVAIAGCQ
jgi:hypothetical protein